MSHDGKKVVGANVKELYTKRFEALMFKMMIKMILMNVVDSGLNFSHGGRRV